MMRLVYIYTHLLSRTDLISHITLVGSINNKREDVLLQHITLILISVFDLYIYIYIYLFESV